MSTNSGEVQLAQLWFKYKNQSLSNETITEVEIEKKAVAEANGFLNELQESIDIKELAKTPLLLCLLIHLKFQNARLPQSRFKAYDQLVEHLISTHPQKRRAAAGLTEPLSELTNNELKNIYANLAFFIQKNFGSGVTDYTNATKIVGDFLKDSDQGLGFDLPKARKLAKVILEIGEEKIGLIVKKSQDELGFFHRAFQEYLASLFLSSIPIEAQLKLIENYCSNPQWREVILGLMHMNNRKEDIKRFIDTIKSKPANVIEQNNIDLLIAEIIFGDSNCSVSLARALAEDIFIKIETGAWMPQRERLLHQVIGGLKSTKVKELVKTKLQRWFPAKKDWYRQYIFKAMGKWPKEREAHLKSLWQGLYDEEIDNKRAAAKSLAILAGGDSKLGYDLARLAKKYADPLVRAVAIEALVYGWANLDDLENILAFARKSLNPELRLVAIIGLIERQRQTEVDLDELLRLGANADGVGFRWRESVGKALMKGWPNSSKIKEMCLKALQRGMRNDKNLEYDIALHVLLTNFQQDEDVVQYIIKEIKREKYPFLSANRHKVWQLIGKNFRDNAALVVAVDEWMKRQEDFHEPEVSLAALIGRTPTAKSILLSFLDKKRFLQWPTASLLEGWGIGDSDIHRKLIEIAYGPAKAASWIAHFLPKIIEDKKKCEERLMEILRDPECERVGWCIDGLNAFGQTVNTNEIIDTILKKLDRHETNSNYKEEEAISHLITAYPFDERVRKLAIQELSKHNGNISAVASVYGTDEEIRHLIIKHVNPLPVYLRSIIASTIAKMANENSFVISLLKNYDIEDDGNVKALASIGFHQGLIESGLNTTDALDYLQKNIVCYGPDYEIRRQAFFCGLVLLNRLDLIINAKETIGTERIYSISLENDYFSEKQALIKFILEHWNKIKQSFGHEFFSRLDRSENNLFNLWNMFCLFADDYSEPREEAIFYLEKAEEKPISANILRFIGRAHPRSRLLLEYCIDAILRKGGRDYYSYEIMVLASELLGIHFGGDKDVLDRIIGATEKSLFNESKIISLCEGWPESEELDKMFKLAREKKPQLSYSAYFHLICRKNNNRLVFDQLLAMIPTTKIWLVQSVLRPVIQRMKREPLLVEMFERHLLNTPTPSEKASLPKLLKTATGLTENIRNWCTEEVDRQLCGAAPPEIGGDIFQGELRPVAHSLMDSLSD